MPVHIHPTAPLAPRALLPDDPGQALALAQHVLAEPRMFNHSRGLWGYTGTAADGEPLTIQSTGIGGPSAAIVMHELCDLGLRRAVRVGTCAALAGELELGDDHVADGALAADGTSRALGASALVAADGELSGALLAAAGDGARAGVVASSDLPYDGDAARAREWAGAGALAVDLESAALLRVAQLRGVRAGCALAVSDVVEGGARRRIDTGALLAAGQRLGETAAAALS
jgi:uridine phosphorylase